MPDPPKALNVFYCYYYYCCYYYYLSNSYRL